MSKNFIFKFLIALAGVAVASLWLLSLIVPDTFGFFTLCWAISIFAGVAGVTLILKGLFEKNVITLKKFNIIIGSSLVGVSIFALIGGLIKSEGLVVPIIAVIATVALLLSLIATGGKKFDQADNKKVGYKNYNDRKKEEEKKNKDK